MHTPTRHVPTVDARRLQAMATAACLAVLLGGCPDPAPSSTSCASTGATAISEGSTPRITVADVTGDGRDDAVELGEGRLAVGDAGAVTDLEATWLTALGADLDGDGHRDLLVASPWDARVHAFLGPVTGDRSWSRPDLAFTAPPTHREMSTQFGRSMAVLDADDDGTPDLLVAAPSYGEVGCLGQLAPAVFLGPFDEDTRSRQQADRILYEPGRPGDPDVSSCLGERAACEDRALVLWSTNGTSVTASEAWSCWSYPLPLDAEPPDTCE